MYAYHHSKYSKCGYLTFLMITNDVFTTYVLSSHLADHFVS